MRDEKANKEQDDDNSHRGTETQLMWYMCNSSTAVVDPQETVFLSLEPRTYSLSCRGWPAFIIALGCITHWIEVSNKIIGHILIDPSNQSKTIGCAMRTEARHTSFCFCSLFRMGIGE